jgi:RNA polymerase sigma-70 factor (ECF subfamily)
MHDIDDDELRALLPRLRRFALGLTRDTHAADDLVQSSLEKALSRWTSRRVDGNLQAWLFSILYRQFLDGQRSVARFGRWLERLSDAPDTAPSAEETLLARSALASLERLSTDQRAVLLLVAVEGMSYQQVAQTLEVPIGTVMSRLSRARQAFRAVTDGETPRPSLRVAR